jgi:hypothetical protein
MSANNKLYMIKNPSTVLNNNILDSSENIYLSKGRSDYSTIMQYATNNNLLTNSSKVHKSLTIPTGEIFSDAMRFSATNFASKAIIPTLCQYNVSTSGYLNGETTIDNLISINQIIINLQNQGQGNLKFPGLNISSG